MKNNTVVATLLKTVFLTTALSFAGAASAETVHFSNAGNAVAVTSADAGVKTIFSGQPTVDTYQNADGTYQRLVLDRADENGSCRVTAYVMPEVVVGPTFTRNLTRTALNNDTAKEGKTRMLRKTVAADEGWSSFTEQLPNNAGFRETYTRITGNRVVVAQSTWKGGAVASNSARLCTGNLMVASN